MIRLAVRVAKPQAEMLLAQLLELAPSGVEEVDHGEEIEYAIFGSPGEVPSLPDLEAVSGDIHFKVSTSECEDGWDTRWRQFHNAVTISQRVHIRPPWQQPAAKELLDIVIDPAQAFGTGAHPTTRLCLELLLKLPVGGELVDLGCGSGVLAIAAAKLGFSPVIALDNDPEAVAATVLNAEVNAVELQTSQFDLRTDSLPTAPLIVANLLRPLLLEMAKRTVEPPRRLIVSGLLNGEGEDIAEAFSRFGLQQSLRLSEGDWEALLLERQ